MDLLPRRARDLSKYIDKAVNSLEGKLGRSPEVEEIAEFMEVGIPEFLKAREKVSTWLISLDDGHTYKDEKGYEKKPGVILPPIEQSSDALDLLVQRDRAAMVREAVVAVLNEQEQSFVNMYYGQEMTMEEVGKVLGLTESRIS